MCVWLSDVEVFNNQNLEEEQDYLIKALVSSVCFFICSVSTAGAPKNDNKKGKRRGHWLSASLMLHFLVTGLGVMVFPPQSLQMCVCVGWGQP